MNTKLLSTIIVTTVFVGVLIILVTPMSVSAIEFKPQVTIGSFTAGVDKGISPSTLGEYIVEIYKYGIGITGILAVVVMMWGGTLWITSGGNPSMVQNAQAYISGALTGLLLALGSYTILAFINPDLTKLKPINPTVVSGAKSCCDIKNGPTSPSAVKDDKTNSLIYSCPGTSQECTAGKQCYKPAGSSDYTCGNPAADPAKPITNIATCEGYGGQPFPIGPNNSGSEIRQCRVNCAQRNCLEGGFPFGAYYCCTCSCE